MCKKIVKFVRVTKSRPHFLRLVPQNAMMSWNFKIIFGATHVQYFRVPLDAQCLYTWPELHTTQPIHYLSHTAN